MLVKLRGDKYGYCSCTKPILVRRVVWAQIIKFASDEFQGSLTHLHVYMPIYLYYYIYNTIPKQIYVCTVATVSLFSTSFFLFISAYMCHTCGLRASNTWLYLRAGQSCIRTVYASGRYGNSVHYGDEYYFYFMGGHALTSRKGGEPCPPGTLNYGVVSHLAF